MKLLKLMALVATLMAINAAYASQYGGNKNSPILIATMEHLENEEAGGVTPEKKSPNLDAIGKNPTFEKGINTTHHIHPDKGGGGGGGGRSVKVSVVSDNGKLTSGGGMGNTMKKGGGEGNNGKNDNTNNNDKKVVDDKDKKK